VTKALKLRAGVIGAGVFGRLHAQKYAGIDGVQLIGISDEDGARAVDASAAHGVGAFTHIEDLLREVDIVSVATPAVTHAKVALRCLEANKHVYVEKPIAVDLADADRLIAMAEARGLILQTGHQERLIFAASGLMSRAARPTFIESVRAGPFNGRATDVSVVLDLMIHDIDLIHMFLPSPVSSIKAVERSGPGGASDEVEAELLLANGARVKLLASRNAREKKRFMRGVYPDGEITIDFLARTVTNKTPHILPDMFLEGDQALPDIVDSVGQSIRRFVLAVRGEGQVLIEPADARRALETANAILRAAQHAETRLAHA
jgi:predicted dehydrogenase